MPADQFTTSPSLTFVKKATWIGQGLLRLMRPRSRSLRSIFLIGTSICIGNSLMIDLAQSPSLSPTAFRPARVYNENFQTLMPDYETGYWTSDGTLLGPELCNNKIILDPCRIRLPVPLIPFVSSLIGILLPRFLNLEWMAKRRWQAVICIRCFTRRRFSSSRKNCMGVVLGGTSRMTVPRNSTVLRAAIVVDPAEPTQRALLRPYESSGRKYFLNGVKELGVANLFLKDGDESMSVDGVKTLPDVEFQKPTRGRTTEGFFIERGKSRVASRLTNFSESEEDLSSDHPKHEGASLEGGIAQGLKSSIQILSFFRYATPRARSKKIKWAVVMSEFAPICIYLVISPLVSLIPLGVPFPFASNSSTYLEKLSAYECGFDPFGDARSRFDIRFYLVSILFIIPDLEVTFSFR
ncbi:NADH-ubiquinone oxidoreductase chain 3 [Tanacetum coccineum]|uniref:NADH-ubiquinone oxidoreductase chain 3 n=1 Tax=Tanacetum coccineum TaxID=301880 RepID=A0ABQ5DDA1_9ASTR